MIQGVRDRLTPFLFYMVEIFSPADLAWDSMIELSDIYPEDNFRINHFPGYCLLN
jgi:hypothetical protein